jgi:pilus assembly protein FimV
MTIIGAVPRDEAEAPVVEAEAAPEEPEAEPEPEDEPEPELPPAAEEEPPVGPEAHDNGRRRWWRRRSEEQEPEAPPEQPRHVRVLGDDDPWDHGFDAPVSAEAEEVTDTADEEELVDEGGRRVFRRR